MRRVARAKPRERGGAFALAARRVATGGYTMTPGTFVGGRYEIESKIAEGGMGSVFRARHTLSKKLVALKVIQAESARDEATRQRFLREVAAPAQIGHRGIVEIYDAGFDVGSGALFVAMELLEGHTLRQVLERGALPRERVFSIFLRLLEPLAAAHAAGFVHRDLKPENVFIQRLDGVEVVKLLDFGIARHLRSDSESVTATGIAIGTPHYMSPEQAASARDVGFSTDVWAVGVMLYEALSGSPPFRGDTLASLVVDVLTRPHRPLLEVAPGTPIAVATVIDGALDKQAEGRPADAGALLRDLRRALEGVAVAPPDHLASTTPITAGAIPVHSSGVATSPLPAGSVAGPHGTATARATAPTVALATPPAFGSTPSATQPDAAVPWGGPGSQPGSQPGASFNATNPSSATAPSPAPRSRTALYLVLGLLAGGVLLVGTLGVGGLAYWAYQGVGEHRVGELTLADPVLATGRHFDLYEFSFALGQRVTLDVTSAAFDPRLIIQTPSGRHIDDDPAVTGAHMELSADEAGAYHVLVLGTQANALGPYELTVH